MTSVMATSAATDRSRSKRRISIAWRPRECDLRDAYAGATVCAPSRCVLMTGLHVGHARIRGLVHRYLPGAALEASDMTVAEVLKDAGYATGMIGKWGLGEPKNGCRTGCRGGRASISSMAISLTGTLTIITPTFSGGTKPREASERCFAKIPIYKGNVSEKKVRLCARPAG